MDFTINTYKKLLKSLISQGYIFKTFSSFLSDCSGRYIILRHDVDKLPLNSLKLARIQFESGIKGSYYFRTAPDSWNVEVIKEISRLGHEIGYHYEDLNLAAQLNKSIKSEEELVTSAIKIFQSNLARLREITEVKTICMHGSPLGRWDNRLLWKYYDFHDFGLIGEPYFDLNFDDILYLTDTGRTWDGDIFSIRDKTEIPGYEANTTSYFKGWKVVPINYSYKTINSNLHLKKKLSSTFSIIESALKGELPDRLMFNFHPQRWSDEFRPWISELIFQNIKNSAKFFLSVIEKKKIKNLIL